MSTMGIAVYNNNNNNNSTANGTTTATGNEREQLMLLRTLQDNECNIIGGSTQRAIAPKNNVSVINVNTNVGQQQQQQQLQQTQQSKTEQQSQQSQNSQVLPPYDPSRLKKHGKNGQPPPIAVAKRNARERNRVKQVNNGFATLRQHIPSHVAQGYGDRGKKLSKVETLRMAVEYIRGLQRLLAEADGLDYDAISASARNRSNDSPMMIPSPTGSVYSNSTHNGSGDVLCMDEQQSVDHVGLDEDVDGDSYLVDEDDEEAEAGEKRDSKRFRANESAQNRLSENQNRPAQRRRHDSPTSYYVSRQSNSFGDEENIEPTNNLTNKNNNTTLANNNNNNNLLATFSPILLQSSPAADVLVKREIRLIDEDDTRPSTEDEAITTAGSNVVLATSSPYTGEILIENPETGRLVPLKLEDHDSNAQLVYVTTSAEGLPTATYYKHEDGSLGAVGTGVEFMDVMSWWEHEQTRVHQQLQAANNQNHLVVQHHPQPHHAQHHHHHHHQQIAAAGQQRLAHV